MDEDNPQDVVADAYEALEKIIDDASIGFSNGVNNDLASAIDELNASLDEQFEPNDALSSLKSTLTSRINADSEKITSNVLASVFARLEGYISDYAIMP